MAPKRTARQPDDRRLHHRRHGHEQRHFHALHEYPGRGRHRLAHGERRHRRQLRRQRCAGRHRRRRRSIRRTRGTTRPLAKSRSAGAWNSRRSSAASEPQWKASMATRDRRGESRRRLGRQQRLRRGRSRQRRLRLRRLRHRSRRHRPTARRRHRCHRLAHRQHHHQRHRLRRAEPFFQTGFIAQQIGSFKAGGYTAPLTAGTDGPFFLVPSPAT